MTIWQVLGLDGPAERGEIRRAYARKLRTTHPEDDPEGFKVLREAYEQALAQAEHHARWAAYEAEEQDEPDDVTPDEGDLWSEIAADAAPPWQAAPTPVPDDDPEIAALFATRQADLATLRDRMAALEAGLRGPWRASDADLDRRLHAILDSDAMGDLGLRDDIEPWLADLIVDTVPASDAILRQAVDAFAWDADGSPRHYAIAGVIERLDEWRLIAALGRHGHDHHAGWRSLTSAPGNAFLWRLDAFRPSVQRGAAALLGPVGEMSPGLRHSFDAASVERWSAFLAQPRLTLGMLFQVPVLCLGLCWLIYVLAPQQPLTVVAGFSALLAVIAPVVTLLVLAPRRVQWRARYRAGWTVRGWVPAYGAALVLAGLLPGVWPVVLALPALGIAAWAFVTQDAEQPDRTGLGVMITFGMVAFFLSAALLDVLSPAQGFALATGVVLYFHLRLYRRRAAAAIIGRYLGDRREWWLLFLVVTILALGIAIVGLRESWAPVPLFYPVALCILALLLPIGATEPGAGPPRGIVKAILIFAFMAAFIASMPPKATTPPAPSAAVPLADNAAGRSDDDVLPRSGNAQRALIAMESSQPGFAGVRTGNPALYAALRTDLATYYAGKATRAEALAAFGRRIDAVYQERLPDADPYTLLETQRIRLSVLQTLRKVDVAACAEEGAKAYDVGLLTDAQRDRYNAQIYTVVASPPVPRALQGDVPALSNEQVSTRTAARLDIGAAEMAARLAGRRGQQAQCDTKIAMLTVLMERPQEAVVAMLRRELRRSRAE